MAALASAIGGAAIGLAASGLLLVNGRIAGVSGIVGHAIRAEAGDRSWRLAFVAGLVVAGVLLRALYPGAFDVDSARAIAPVAVAGLLVGIGTHLARGCTSGHGVCGIARRSPRSVVATCVFMFTGALTVFLVRHVVGVSP